MSMNCKHVQYGALKLDDPEITLVTYETTEFETKQALNSPAPYHILLGKLCKLRLGWMPNVYTKTKTWAESRFIGRLL